DPGAAKSRNTDALNKTSACRGDRRSRGHSAAASYAVPRVFLPALELADGYDNDLAIRIYLDARHGLPSGDDGPNRPGHVTLSEYGGKARHDDYREVCLWAVMRRSRQTDGRLEVVKAVA